MADGAEIWVEERPAQAPTAPSTLAKLAAATPSTRDRYVDFLRAFSIGVVVLGHWLIAVVVWRGDVIRGDNVLDLVPRLWLATWVFQVMPIFFFVGGFSNLVTLESVRRRGGSAGSFVRSRLIRLLRPTGIFMVTWILAAPTFELLPGVPAGTLPLALSLAIGPLWFLGVYLLMVVLSPFTARLHARHRLKALLATGGSALLIDWLRFGLDLEPVGFLNVLVIWVFVHQMGYFYADGTFGRLPRAAFWVMALAGLAGLVVLTAWGPYPGSMVGLPGDPISNMNPPTTPIMALAIWQIGLAMLLRGPISRWLERPRIWEAVIGMNAIIMTVFLWHLTALLLTVLIVYPAGFPQPPAASAAWWLLRPVWAGLVAVILAFLVSVFGRFERPRLRARAAQYWDFSDFYTL